MPQRRWWCAGSVVNSADSQPARHLHAITDVSSPRHIPTFAKTCCRSASCADLSARSCRHSNNARQCVGAPGSVKTATAFKLSLWHALMILHAISARFATSTTAWLALAGSFADMFHSVGHVTNSPARRKRVFNRSKFCLRPTEVAAEGTSDFLSRRRQPSAKCLRVHVRSDLVFLFRSRHATGRLHSKPHEMKQLTLATDAIYATDDVRSLTRDVREVKRNGSEELADALQRRCRTGERGASSPPVLREQAGATRLFRLSCIRKASAAGQR